MSREVRTQLAKEILALKWPDPLVDATRGWNNALDVLVAVKLTDDIEKVVRCKDCAMYKKDKELAEANYCDPNFYCGLLRTEMDEDGYCSYGKRKDG